MLNDDELAQVMRAVPPSLVTNQRLPGNYWPTRPHGGHYFHEWCPNAYVRVRSSISSFVRHKTRYNSKTMKQYFNSTWGQVDHYFRGLSIHRSSQFSDPQDLVHDFWTYVQYLRKGIVKLTTTYKANTAD